MRKRRRALPMILSALVLVGALVYAAVSWFFSEQLIAQKFKALGPVDVTPYGLPQPESDRIRGDGVIWRRGTSRTHARRGARW